MVLAGVERHQQAHLRLGEVLRLVDDDRVVARTVARLRELERAQAQLREVRLPVAPQPFAIALVA